VLFANMDSLGLNYPAYHLGTEFFWNNINDGGVPPWFTFVKATPTAPNAAYPDTGAGSPGANISANATAIGRFRSDLQAALLAGFEQQGRKYNFSMPLENPLRYNRTARRRTRTPASSRPNRPTPPTTSRGSRRSAMTRRARGRAGVLRQGHSGVHGLGREELECRREPVCRGGQRQRQGNPGDRVCRQPDHLPAGQRNPAARHDHHRGGHRGR
jgi:hypothetical protein